MSELNYSPDTFDIADLETASSTAVGDEEFGTVFRYDVDKGTGIYVGQGRSRNPLQAEGSITGDIQNSTPTALEGKYRLVVLNSQNNVVENGIIAQGKLSALRNTRANTLDGDITPFVDIEVKEPYQVGFQVKLKSGTDTVSDADSTLEIDGFSGEALN